MLSRASRILWLGWAVLLASTAALAQSQPLPPEGLAQIRAYTAEKMSRTPAEQKLDSTLLYAMRTVTGQPAVNDIPGPLPFVQGFIAERVRADGTIQVTIRADVNADLLAAIAAVGGTRIQTYPQFGVVTAWMPIGALLVISDRDDVRFIRPIEEGTTNRYVPTDGDRKALVAKAIPPITKAGSVNSQGVHAHGADLAINTGIDGTGVKICVLSNGVDSLATSQGTGDLPAVDVVAGQAGSNDEGTAMLEIVHDMAPNAALGFATANGGLANFANNILLLRNAPHNCDIIVDDFTYFLEGVFQDGAISQAVNTVTAAGAMFFSSAANSGNLTHGTSGTWEGDFVDGGAATGVLAGDGNVHDFGGALYDTLTARGSAIVLGWSDPLAASDNDYDLYVLNSAGTTVVATSTGFQTGTQDPHEFISCSTASNCPTGGRIVVVLFSGAARALRVDTERGGLSINTAGATFGHNAAGSAFTVAAANVANASGGLFTGGPANPVETFSSDGPRRIFYNPNGTAITPGNVLFGTGGGTSLSKDDLTAADGVSTTLPATTFLNPFFGTSAAAPHAAAIAGLIKSAKLTATNAQVKTALLNSALDIEAVGSDRDSGVGIVMAPAGVRALLNTLVVAKSFAPNPIAVGGTSVLTITLQNTNAIALKQVAFTDTYPSNVVNSGTPNANITGAGCSGSLAATGGGNTLTFGAGVVPAGTTCSYKVTVTSGTAGTYLDGTGAVTTPIALNSPAASASLQVGSAPTVPGPPTGVTATAGNTQATVTFTAPASDGGSAITGYTAASNPAGGVDSNAGSTATTHLVTGLTNGTAYTFTVTATNAVGPGAPSAPSNSVTPSLSLCTYALSPLDLSNTAAAGGVRNITVTTPPGCPVTATSFQPWVTVTGITPNGGTTTVTLQVAANAGATRATALVVAGRLYLITQLNP